MAGHPNPQAHQAPVRLEVNFTGLWHPVVDFDAKDPVAEALMRAAVQDLGAIDSAAAFRVVTRDALKAELITYTGKHGWSEK